MIKHIVMFRFQNIENKENTLKMLKSMIEDLKNKIPEVQHIEAGINFSEREVAYDIALISDFKSKEDLEIYRVHPDHVALVDFLKQYNYEVAVADYNY